MSMRGGVALKDHADSKLDLAAIDVARERLLAHPVLQRDALGSMDDVRLFMSHHVYPVWDFMSLLKCLQNTVTEVNWPWTPVPGFSNKIVRLVNSIVLDEESDITPDPDVFLSHYELYVTGMKEIGCDTGPVEAFTTAVRRDGIEAALALPQIPEPSRAFMRSTFSFLDRGVHEVAAAFAFGRETLIPPMFGHLLHQLDVGKADAPYFHFYLARHIEVDGEDHGDASLELVESLCDTPEKVAQAQAAALEAIDARIALWDGVGKTLWG